MSFQITSLPESEFSHLFTIPSTELNSFGAIRMVATRKPGFPCRVSLRDADIGEEVLLIHHEHQTADTPYRASHAIFVRVEAQQANPILGEVPQMLRSRTLSLRAFDEKGMMIGAELTEGTAVESVIEELFSDDKVAYIHIHFAKAGCYAALVNRA